MDPPAQHVYGNQSYQNPELLHIRPQDEGISTEKSERQSQVDECQRGLDQVFQVEAHADHSLSPCQMLADGAKEAKLEHDRSLYMSDKLYIRLASDGESLIGSTYPSRALLDVCVI